MKCTFSVSAIFLLVVGSEGRLHPRNRFLQSRIHHYRIPLSNPILNETAARIHLVNSLLNPLLNDSHPISLSEKQDDWSQMIPWDGRWEFSWRMVNSGLQMLSGGYWPLPKAIVDSVDPELSYASPDSPERYTWGYKREGYAEDLPRMLKYYGSQVLVLVAGVLLYRYMKKDPQGIPNDGFDHKIELLQGRWRFGLFECFGDAKTSFLVCCCPVIRWADTIRMAGFLGFWAAFGLIIGVQFVNLFTLGFLSLAVLILLIFYRQKQRQMFQMENGTCGSYLEDCLTYSCCGCCAIVQEARHIEEAWVVEHPALPAPRLQ